MRGKIARELRKKAAYTDTLPIISITEGAANTTQRRKYYRLLKRKHHAS